MTILVVFLDIDGVLNTRDSWKTPFQLNDDCIKAFCEYLNTLKYEIRIVLTSSWKNGYSSIPENETSQLKDLRNKLNIYGLSIFGRTKSLNNRVEEIQEYISSHEVNSYLIIDDDSNEYTKEYLKKVSLINAETGFTKEQKRKIIFNKN